MGDELTLALREAGGADAGREHSARLRRLLIEELERGERELGLRRTGYPDAIVVALAASGREAQAALPVTDKLRADAGAVGERGGYLAAAVVEELAVLSGAPPPSSADDLSLLLGSAAGYLVPVYPAAADAHELVELVAQALNERFERTDRLRCEVHVLPSHALEVEEPRPPIGATHPLRVVEAAARLGGSSLVDAPDDGLADALAAMLEPPGVAARAHADPDPSRRAARRILQRLDGMGKWGGYHTEFTHLARGFGRGNERALAAAVGEALVAAGLLVEKQSVGQRHVSLNPRRSGDVRRLIDEGTRPPGLSLPAAPGR